MNGYFDLKMALAPVWQGDTIRNESLLFTPESSGEADLVMGKIVCHCFSPV